MEQASASPQRDRVRAPVAQSERREGAYATDLSPRGQSVREFAWLARNGPAAVAQRKRLESLYGSPPAQLTIYKIASEKPKFHETDPAKYSELTGDKLVEKSLHLDKENEIDLSISTSPITIFIHGGTLDKMNAQEFYSKFLEPRKYVPKQAEDIIFITCSGAKQMDQFLVSKGQALANILGARVHLAKGPVHLNAHGVPYVKNPDGEGHYRYIDSKEELASILRGESVGWRTYQPEAVTYEILAKAIRDGKLVLYNGFHAEGFRRRAQQHLETYNRITEVLKTDRTRMASQYRLVETVRKRVQIEWVPSVVAWERIDPVRREVADLAERSTAHKQHAERITQEFAAWQDGLAEGRGSPEGYISLIEEKVVEWVAPLRQAVEKEFETPLKPGDGWDDDFELPDLDSGDEATDANPTVAPTSEKTGQKKADERSGGLAVIQRTVLADATPLANGRTLAQIVEGLPHIGLVQANNNLDLRIRFAAASGYGVTRLKVGDQVVTAAEYIKPTTANHHYVIETDLNGQLYRNGASRESIGSLVETLTHEWTLHGAEHAVNIDNARRQQSGKVKFDHEQLFSDDANDTDRGMAIQILRSDKDIGRQIYESYMNDVDSHVSLVKKGWSGEHLYKGVELFTEFSLLVDFGQNCKTLTPEAQKIFEPLGWSLGFYTGTYESWGSLDGLNIAETLKQVRALGQLERAKQSEVVGLVIDQATSRCLPLLEELAEVTRIGKIKDPLANRKKALADLGVDADDLGVGAVTGLDKGVDFEGSEKKNF